MCPENFHEINHFLPIVFLAKFVPKISTNFPWNQPFFAQNCLWNSRKIWLFFHDLPEALFITKCRTVSRYFKYINCCIKFNERIKQCIVFLLFTFQKEEIYLNLVLDFVPETVYRVARHYSKAKQTIPILYIKVS